jgi:hypothetical protein
MEWDEQPVSGGPRGVIPDFSLSPWMGRQISEAERRAQVRSTREGEWFGGTWEGGGEMQARRHFNKPLIRKTRACVTAFSCVLMASRVGDAMQDIGKLLMLLAGQLCCKGGRESGLVDSCLAKQGKHSFLLQTKILVRPAQGHIGVSLQVVVFVPWLARASTSE